jgi:hypothetical protein
MASFCDKGDNLWIENLLSNTYLLTSKCSYRHLTYSLFCSQTCSILVRKLSGGRSLEDHGVGTITLECYSKETGFAVEE